MLTAVAMTACTSKAETPATPSPKAQEVRVDAPATPGGYVDLTYAAEKSVHAVVYIKVTKMGRTHRGTRHDPIEQFFGEFFGQSNHNSQQRGYREPETHGAGSGVIISSDGYIVTNHHVIDGADEILVKLNDNREFAGRIIGLDEGTDLALIKVEATDLPTLPIGNSDELRLGQWVLAVGNPFNLTSTVTAGIVSAKARSLGANGIESFIQTDAAINQGNSGGALVNERGELVGINAMLYSETGSYSGYGFAIPTTIMNKVVADLKTYGTVQRAMLGISGIDLSIYLDAEKEKGNTPDLGTLSGVWVASVGQGSAADKAGMQEGDVIIEIDGKQVHKMSELQEQLAQHRPGDKVKLAWMRNKEKVVKDVTLTNEQGTTEEVHEIDEDELGIALQTISHEEKTRLGISYGLQVKSIREGKMKQAGITKGTIILSVNDTRLATIDDWKSAVQDAHRSSDRALWIRALSPSGRKVSFVVDLNEDAEHDPTDAPSRSRNGGSNRNPNGGSNRVPNR